MPPNVRLFGRNICHLESIIPNASRQPNRPARFYSAMSRPNFAPGSDVAALDAALTPLLAPGRWQLTPDGEGLERTFKFKTFAKTWDFMTAVSLQCKIKNHHPEWSNVYNTTFIRWTTHSPKGLSAKDVDLAAVCDSLATAFGEVKQNPDEENAKCKMRDLTSTVTTNSGDCCVPKPSK
ncbi:hypothetical protein MCOR27_010947 [Pyricularia oryzae]|uniref:4a-hydroxytetrahydrobiopterin dehydratase n=5 Tax=Pyricularia TaxID=48558 RepID=A0ABQ8NDQ0_PYRGI|nr:uncharacterized protein MGG_06132 [Pyricularia oryzae 70-15]ELQ40154.1 hypothetical protein OOU_Y34scaffold00460g8 [Pyricularia oryzae Y34]KAH8847444.1 hypothetical protein MCOR01_000875 [Pyricularia oryzae]KAI6295381.1 hypothetical protein MCOR33_007724 [Pyricularia grisea]EHA52196.1 hypothetical protein MGG_06132 [Pyricularia oryzae 70-15]KAH9428361.1 hypothetical protein MCOR02_010915 [Pyricularia oryzae]